MAATAEAQNDPLARFLRWYFKEPRPVMAPSDDGVHFIEGATGIVVFRKAPFQVQMFIVEPDIDIPDHTHPNVDSFEVHLSGDVWFRRNGEEHRTREFVSSISGHGTSLARGTYVRITPNTPHGARVGPRGGSFYSVQMWMNGVTPTSVANDWGEGEATMGPSHTSQVTTKQPVGEGDVDFSEFQAYIRQQRQGG